MEVHRNRPFVHADMRVTQICSHKIEFSFLNANLMVPASPLSIFNYDTFPMVEALMFGNSSQSSVAVPSFLYLMMAATYFRQARRTRRSHVRAALRDLGREYVINADGMVLVHARPGRGLHPLTSNTQS
jgi:hypothetical protein